MYLIYQYNKYIYSMDIFCENTTTVKTKLKTISEITEIIQELQKTYYYTVALSVSDDNSLIGMFIQGRIMKESL